ncbi:hypothetical protein ASPZODRAFT_1079328 [Penicilliopsis zonata CBS 506.65]|uniref:Uncharacterized protein n=1 Tax=Penicilliopsis zonata CBS 506.65 TaxID=1073090 RepID=A0A1L9SRZ4_9EURO|nr:hypothetical protein ASPZODRAFT_1079328 [Penicilliopsis zonata CBS 506.65]OJJ49970.1 hypothetical protein ASPZODRAFT_1079328 [Penicilliopsis zonata CBS 506.65]
MNIIYLLLWATVVLSTWPSHGRILPLPLASETVSASPASLLDQKIITDTDNRIREPQTLDESQESENRKPLHGDFVQKPATTTAHLPTHTGSCSFDRRLGKRPRSPPSPYWTLVLHHTKWLFLPVAILLAGLAVGLVELAEWACRRWNRVDLVERQETREKQYTDSLSLV